MHCKTRENWPFSGLFFNFRVIFVVISQCTCGSGAAYLAYLNFEPLGDMPSERLRLVSRCGMKKIWPGSEWPKSRDAINRDVRCDSNRTFPNR